MARFNGGWIKIHRDLMEKDIAQHALLLSLWVYLLTIANYKPSQIIWNGKQRTLERGQLIFKIREVSERWGCSPSTIHKWLRFLEKSERIKIEARTRGTIVTICNYDQYQNTEDDERTPTDQRANTERTPSEHGANYSEERKKERKKEENPPTPQMQKTWAEVRNEFVDKFPGDGDRLDGAYAQIKREGMHGATPVKYPLGYIAKMWPLIRAEYAHHDKPKLKVVKEEPFDQEAADKVRDQVMGAWFSKLLQGES